MEKTPESTRERGKRFLDELKEKGPDLSMVGKTIVNLVLTKKSDYDYQGILSTKEIRKPDSKYFNTSDSTDNIFKCEYDISVITDQDTFQYTLGNKRLLK